MSSTKGHFNLKKHFEMSKHDTFTCNGRCTNSFLQYFFVFVFAETDMIMFDYWSMNDEIRQIWRSCMTYMVISKHLQSVILLLLMVTKQALMHWCASSMKDGHLLYIPMLPPLVSWCNDVLPLWKMSSAIHPNASASCISLGAFLLKPWSWL